MPQLIFCSPEKLAGQIKSDLLNLETSTVGIDGMNGAGKTWLAAKLGELLSATVVSLDNHLAKEPGSYVPSLQIANIQHALGNTTPLRIVEGVCLLGAAERIGVVVDRLVYVKHLDRYGDWLDQDTCEAGEDAEEFIRKQTEESKPFNELLRKMAGEEPSDNGQDDGLLPPLTNEIIRYHAKEKPALKADYIFERIDT